MTRQIPVDKIIRDEAIFPRTRLDQDAVLRYREAYELGESLPPLIVEKGTNRLLDGWHRNAAQIELGHETAEVEFHDIPDGVPALLYAAGLASRHGLLLPDDSKRQVARKVFTDNPEMSAEVVAKHLACNPRTVRRWVEDLNEARQRAGAEQVEVRRSAVALLVACGLSQRQIAAVVGVDEKLVRTYGQVSDGPHLRLATDPTHAAAVLASIPDEHKPAAYDALQALLKEQQELVKERKAADQVVTDWRELEEAARTINGWVKRGQRKPSDTSEERVKFVIDALTNGVKALTEGEAK